MKITYEMLVSLNACDEHLELFRKTFPEDAERTVENFDKAVAAGLDVQWLLSSVGSREFHQKLLSDQLPVILRFHSETEEHTKLFAERASENNRRMFRDREAAKTQAEKDAIDSQRARGHLSAIADHESLVAPAYTKMREGEIEILRRLAIEFHLIN